MKEKESTELAKRYLAEGNLNAALAVIQGVIKLNPNLADNYQIIGEIHKQLGNLTAAILAYSQALEIQPDAIEAHVYLGQLYSQQGLLEKAVFHYQQALNQKPEWSELHYNLGNVFYRLGDLPSALNNYQQAIGYNPSYVDAYYNMGVIFDESGQLELAIHSYQTAIGLQPDYALAYSNMGAALVKLGNFAEAIKIYQKALQIQPNWATLHNNLGQVFIAQEKVDQATASYLRAIQLQPDFGLAHYNLGKVLQYQDLHAAAFTCFERVIELDSHHIAAYSDCGFSLIAQSKITEAINYFQKAIGLQNNFVESFCNWVNQQLPQDDLDRARTACVHFLKALQGEIAGDQVDDYLAQIHLYLGNVLLGYGRYKDAKYYYQYVLKIQPNNSDAYEKFGSCIYQQQQLKNIENVKGVYASVLDWIGAVNLSDRDYLQVNLEPGLEASDISRHTVQSPTSKQPCEGLNCRPCLQRILNWFAPINMGKRIYRFNSKKSIYVQPQTTFVAVIPAGRTWIAPYQNSAQVCNAIATITPDHYLLADLSRDYPGNLPGCYGYNPLQHKIFTTLELPPLQQIDGTVAVFSGLSGNVYFHWMVDILPRIEIMRKAGLNFDKIDWFLINSCQEKFQRETLRILGIPAEKILASDHYPHLQAKQLIVPSFPGYLGWLSNWALHFLRREFLPESFLEKLNYPERIYISRGKARYRRVLNEEDVMLVLRKFGFVSILLESMSFEEQVTLFARAKIIVAPHGSGLTNMIFCSPGTQIIELFSPHYIRHYFWLISQQLQLEHYYLMGDKFEGDYLRNLMYQSPLTEDIMVNIDALSKMMQISVGASSEKT